MKKQFYLFYLLLVFFGLIVNDTLKADPADPFDPLTWIVTPSNYEFNMVLTAVLDIDGSESIDPLDRLAAFALGTNDCRGVAQLQYLAPIDRYEVSMFIYSDQAISEDIIFYISDNSTGAVLPTLDTLPFAVDALYGTPVDPEVITAVRIIPSFNSGDVLCLADTLGFASVNLEGGLPPYDLEWSNGSTTDSIFHLTAGIYYLTVTDQNGFSIVDSVIINNLDSLIQAPTLTAIPDTIACVDDPLFVYAYSIHQGEARYQWYDIFNTQIGVGDFIGQSIQGPTLLSVETNLRNCISARSGISLDAYSEPVAEIFVATTVTSVNETLTFNALNVNPDFDYLWEFGNGATSPNLTTSYAYNQEGAYLVTLTVTTEDGCTDKASVSIFVEPDDGGGGNNVIFVDFITESTSCPDAETGSVTAFPSGGVPPYTYQWSSNGFNINSISGLGAGVYTVTIIDSEGNLGAGAAAVSSAIDEVPSPFIVVNGNQPICPGDNIWAVATSSLTPAEYRWYDAPAGGNLIFIGNSFYLPNIQEGQNYWVETVYFDCLSSDRTQAIIELNPPDASFTASTALLDEGDPVLFTANSILLGHEYFWDFGDGTGTGSDSEPEILHTYNTPGAYEVTLTVTDPDGCTASTSQIVNVLSVIDLSLVLEATPTNCIEDETGTVTAQVFNGAPPYTYIWDNGAATADLNGLLAGTYALTVVDSEGATVSGSIEVESMVGLVPDPVISINGEPTSCAGADIILIATSSFTGAEYRWYDAPVGGNLLFVGNSFFQTDLQQAATYYVETFYNGCISENRSIASFNVEQVDAAFSVSTDVAELGMPIDFTPTNLQAGYTYSWDFGDGNQITLDAPSHIFDEVGTFQVQLTVESPSGCQGQSIQQIDIIPENDLAVVFQVDPVNCPEDTDGSIAATVFNGMAPFTYEWSNGMTGDVINDLGIGSYILTLTDSNGDMLVETVVVSSDIPSVLLPDVTINNGQTVCAGDNLFLLATSPQSNAEFFWYDDPLAGNLLNTGSLYVPAIASQDLELYVEVELDGCLAQDRAQVLVDVEDPNATFTADPLIATEGESILFTPDVVEAGYTYLWDFGDGDVGNIPVVSHPYTESGAYTIGLSVTSPGGCFVENIQPNYINIVPTFGLTAVFTVDNSQCYDGADGSITTEIFNGTPPYDFNWSDGQQTGSIGGLEIGTYTLTVTDNDGNTLIESVVVYSEVPELEAPAVVVPGGYTVCFGEDANLIASSNQGAQEYRWYDAPTGGNLIQVGSIITLEDIQTPQTLYAEVFLDGCFSPRTEVSLDVSQPDAQFSVSPGTTVVAGELVQFIPANSNYFAYNWNFGDGGNSIQVAAIHSYDFEGTYDVSLEVTDAFGCSALLLQENYITVEAEPAISIAFEVDHVLCSTDMTGAITVEASGGVAPYTYDWATQPDGPELNGLVAGTYELTVTDQNGDSFSTSVEVINLEAEIPVPDVSINGNGIICLNSDGFLLASNDQYPNATYNWYENFNDPDPVLTGNPLIVEEVQQDLITYVQTEVNTCLSQIIPVEVMPQAPEVDFDVTPQSNISEGDLVQFVPDPLDPNYQYYWELGDGGWSTVVAPNYFYNLVGVFDVSLTITDEFGCSNTLTKNGFMVVNELPGLQLDPEERASEEEDLEAMAFPNPYFEGLNLVLKVEYPGDYQLNISSVTGKSKVLGQYEFPAGTIELTLNPNELPEESGIQFLSITGPQSSTVLKLIKN